MKIQHTSTAIVVTTIYDLEGTTVEDVMEHNYSGRPFRPTHATVVQYGDDAPAVKISGPALTSKGRDHAHNVGSWSSGSGLFAYRGEWPAVAQAVIEHHREVSA